ncbi:MAG TPA: hypothetical protein VEZ11_00685 [Thermoanaerobaculia bacterium]|nr:hypothetical protein [Thermoanaerobaculia bacterium]
MRQFRAKEWSRRTVFPAVAALILVLVPTLLQAQAVIKVNDTVNFKFGLLLQAWADEQQDAVSRAYAQNLFVRRIRFLVAGQVAPNVTFFYETDNPNLGKAPKALGTGFTTQDAYLEWKPTGSPEFMVDAGLILVPWCRNCLQSAPTHLTLDYGAFSFLQSAPTQSSVGRDTGFQAKGYLDNGRLEYRVGIFQGIRQAGSRNAFRAAGRVQYEFWDTEQVPFYPGTYLGKKKVLAIGGGFDHQQNFKAWALDGFLEKPLANKDSVTCQLDWLVYDGSTTFTAIPKQSDVLAEAGYYITSYKIQPFVRYEDQSFAATANKSKNQQRYQAGLTWYPWGYNYNIRGAFTRVSPKVGNTTNEWTVQMQFFYF